MDIKYLIKPLYEYFLEIFKSLYSIEKNQKFLDLLQNCYSENNIKDFIKCIQHGIQYIVQKENELANKKDEKAKEKRESVKQQRIELETMVLET